MHSNFLGGTLIVSLSGDAKEAQSVVEGRYLPHPLNNNNRGRDYWIQENGSNAIWYKGWTSNEVSDVWIIGNQDDWGRGTQFAAIYSLNKFIPNPLLVSSWNYKASNGTWTTSENILVGPGNVDFDHVRTKLPL